MTSKWKNKHLKEAEVQRRERGFHNLKTSINSKLCHFSLPGTITSWVVIFILPINSALNPILYTLTTRPFKEMIQQFWKNYRQRSIGSKRSRKTHSPSVMWIEMWPLQEMPPRLRKPALFTDPYELSLISQSTRLNSYS